jgi:acyl-CoA thioester hydrolase
MDREPESAALHSFELSFTVEPGDIDQNGHVNNVVYVRWTQDIAIAHWRAAAPEEDQQKLFWVVLRHEIDYKRPSVLGDVLAARTWVGHAAGLRFERHTEFLNRSSGTLVAKAFTIWCPMDLETRKPKNVSADLRSMFSQP